MELQRSLTTNHYRFKWDSPLVAAVVGGLATLWASAGESVRPALTILTKQALPVLFVFGLVSYRRMIHRDGVTEEYKRDTKWIRGKYREVFQAESPELQGYQLEAEIKRTNAASDTDLRHRWKRIKQMGYTQTLAVINGILLALLLIWITALSTLTASLGGLALSTLLCFLGAKQHKSVRPEESSR
jgi:hypothetical protein